MARDIVISIRTEDELTLARSELSAAHAALDSLGVPRYGKTDYPLPLALRVSWLRQHYEFKPRPVHRPTVFGGVQTDLEECIAEVERGT